MVVVSSYLNIPLLWLDSHPVEYQNNVLQNWNCYKAPAWRHQKFVGIRFGFFRSPSILLKTMLFICLISFWNGRDQLNFFGSGLDTLNNERVQNRSVPFQGFFHGRYCIFFQGKNIFYTVCSLSLHHFLTRKWKKELFYYVLRQ